LRLPRQRHQALAQSQREQDPRAVGAHLHAGADFAQRLGLLVDFDIEAAPEQAQRGGEAAEPRPGHHDLGFAAHRTPPARR
jgi:hypothetical protein